MTTEEFTRKLLAQAAACSNRQDCVADLLAFLCEHRDVICEKLGEE